jgi:hypothetical protein
MMEILYQLFLIEEINIREKKTDKFKYSNQNLGSHLRS